MIPPDDRGLLLADGLFETLLAVDGSMVEFAAHVERMRRGCATIGLPAPEPSALARAGADALAEAGLTRGRAALRLTWTAGSGGRGLDRPADPRPRLFASAAAAPPPGQPPLALATAGVRRNADSPASRLKTLAYLDSVLARREAAAAGADEALMLNTRGEVACAAAANLFWFEGPRLVTPALGCGVLDGTVRARVLAAAGTLGLQTAEVAVPRTSLAGARGLFLTNSLIGLRPAASLDGVGVEPAPELEALQRLSSSW